MCVVLLFFFQAEDGIRDLTVTGVQTCALPIYDARRDAPRAPGTLIGRVPRDALGLEAVDSSLGIVARHFVETRIHHRGDLWNRHRRLGDVRRDDDTALRRRAERQLLLVGVERTVQR